MCGQTSCTFLVHLGLYAAFKELTTTVISKVIVEWLTLMLCSQEEPGSNLGLETSYSEVFIGLFSPSSTGTVGALNSATTATSTCSPIHYSLIALSFDANRLILEIKTVVK
jgi:hypothetical protein